MQMRLLKSVARWLCWASVDVPGEACLLSLPSISDPKTVLLGPVDEISAVVVALLELRVQVLASDTLSRI